jgi:hypothetical protein
MRLWSGMIRRGISQWEEASMKRENRMSTLLVMDRTGHSTFEFDPSDSTAVAEAMERFQALIERGYTASERTGTGTQRKVTEFDPHRTETLFHPRLVGG